MLTPFGYSFDALKTVLDADAKAASNFVDGVKSKDITKVVSNTGKFIINKELYITAAIAPNLTKKICKLIND